MLLVAIRTIILFLLVTVGIRMMGKREIGQLQPYELVIMILLAELAATPMANSGIPLVNGVLPILILVLAQVSLSYLSLRSVRAREIICGTPSILIEKGKIIEPELKRIRYNINDLLEQLRAKNMPDLADVEFAILETSGDLSIIPKSQKRPLYPADLNMLTEYEGLPTTLIIDGCLLRENLLKSKINENWLKKKLNKLGLDNYNQVLFAGLDSKGELFYQKKDGD